LRHLSSRKLAKLNSLLYLFTMAIGIIVMMLASSRGPLISVVICILLLLWKSGKLNLRFGLICGFLMLGIWSGTAFTSSYGSSFFERLFALSNEFDTESYGGLGRAGLYKAAFELVVEHPFIGAGIEIPGVGYPHNLTLEAFLVLGIGGGCLFLYFLVIGTMKSFQLLRKQEPGWGWLGLLFLQYMVGGMFSGTLYGSYLFWYGLLSVYAIDWSRKSKKSRKLSSRQASLVFSNCN